MSNIDFDKELNVEQLKVVREGDGPCLVLAGAGSGKTRTIVYRMAYLLERGIRPDKILLLTFTNKAANEMLSRVESLTGVNARLLWGGTFHSVANRFLRKFAPILCFRQNFTILDEDDSYSLIKACIKESGAASVYGRFPSVAVIKHILSFATNSRISIEDALEQKAPGLLRFSAEIKDIGGLYEKKKQAGNMMDFDDLLLNFVKILRDNAETRERLTRHFEYILIDEYQDTNPLQAEMIYLLAPQSKNILVVGDDAQSIYSFRAATVQNILRFPKIYPGTKIFRLETNYRSTPEILNLANEIISKNSAQFSKDLRSVRENFQKPDLFITPTAEAEAEFIAKKIQSFFDAGVSPREIAVLFRATHHSQFLEFELGKHGIQYEYRGGVRFFERAHIKDILAYLRILNQPSDEAAWRRILTIHEGIGEVTAEKIFGEVRGFDSVGEIISHQFAFNLPERARAGWKDFTGILGRLLEYHGQNPAELVKVLANSSYRDYLAVEHENSEDRLEDIGQLAAFAEKYGSLTDFLAESVLYEGSGGRENRSGGDRLVLSTIHQAKGLEWDSVFIINLVDGAFPNQRAASEGELEEERRLFYVAVTRAKRNLILTYPELARKNALAWNAPSMFLREIDENLLAGNKKPKEEVIEYINEDASVKEGDWRKKSFLRSINEL
jgi:DNA helicase-2/ATP-dependent DNA helicase PcrA